jgi:DNA-binding transcriptional MerR regulator
MQDKRITMKNKMTHRRRRSDKHQETVGALPPIPDKRYFTISEVSRLCRVKPYVLRYWEQEFPQLSPDKRRGNRRYYQESDILLVRQIKKLLYEDGFTLSGARSQLTAQPEAVSPAVKAEALIKKMVADLESVLQNLLSELTTSH